MSFLSKDFDVLLNNHPTDSSDERDKPYKQGKVGNIITENHYNTCCARVSTSLNLSNMKIEGYENFVNEIVRDIVKDKNNKIIKNAPGKIRAYPDNQNNYYILSPIDLRLYLNQKYFPSEVYKATGFHELHNLKTPNGGVYAPIPMANPPKEVLGRKGIMIFGNAHADFWDGHKWHEVLNSIWNPFGRSFRSDGGGKIYFWEVKRPAVFWTDLFDFTNHKELEQWYFEESVRASCNCWYKGSGFNLY